MAAENELLILFAIVYAGVVIGRVSLGSFSLGTSGVIFTGLIAGHLGYSVPGLVGALGLTVFVFCLGIDAGPQFFRVLFLQGSRLAGVGVAMVLAAMLTTWGVASAMGLPVDLAAGILAGALTSTPALGAASELLPVDSDLAVGFGIAYPLGTLAVILFVSIAPRLLKLNDKRPSDEEDPATAFPIVRRLVHVLHPKLTGKKLTDVLILSKSHCQISRRLVNGSLEPIPSDFRLEVGQNLLVVGTRPNVELVTDFFGEESTLSDVPLETELHRRRIVATSKNVVGRSLRDLHLRSSFGVTISRIMRHDVEFVPDPDEIIQFGDALNAVGEPEGLDRFVIHAAHRERSFDETDLISLAFGLLLGTLIGQVKFEFANDSISLGLAGGPLLVGLVMGHFGRLGPLRGHFPRASRLLLTEMGLAVFLAQAGTKAGGQFVPVIQQHGFILCVGALCIAIVSMGVGILMTRVFIPLSCLETMGVICGAMTSTPGLGAITSKVDSVVPATSYATVYPVALILMSVLTPALIAMIS